MDIDSLIFDNLAVLGFPLDSKNWLPRCLLDNNAQGIRMA